MRKIIVSRFLALFLPLLLATPARAEGEPKVSGGTQYVDGKFQSHPPTASPADQAKYERLKAELEALSAEYNRACSPAAKDRLAHELLTKNELESAGGRRTAAALHRAKVRISCGTLSQGFDLFACEVQQICDAKGRPLLEKRKQLSAYASKMPPAAPENEPLAAPPALPPRELNLIQALAPMISAPVSVTGQRAVTSPSGEACGIPTTMVIQGDKPTAVLNYRRGRMLKQLRYVLCIERGVSDQDRLACATLVKPMAMADVSANGTYLKHHAEAQRFFACLRARFSREGSPDPTATQLALAEVECMGKGDPTARRQAVYMADLPNCPLASAVSDIALGSPSATKGDAEPGSKAAGPASSAGAARN